MPQVAKLAIRPSTDAPRFSASAAVISTSAAAPSLRPLALAAVTVPSFLNAGLRPCIPSSVAPSRIYSSVSTMVSPLRPLTVTGTISSLKRPDARAVDALFWLPTANRSCSSRVIWYFSARFSAVMPM